LELLGYTLDGYFSPSVNPHPFPDVIGKPKGSWSNDTQLTLITMESLIESKSVFDIDVFVKKHIEAYRDREGHGWGKSTKNACRRLGEGEHWTASGEPNSGGNGVMIKIAPMGLRESTYDRAFWELLRECINYARMTHRNFTAITAGYVHAYAVSLLARETHLNPEEFLIKIGARAFFIEQYLGPHTEMISEQIALLKKMWEDRTLAKETPRALSMRFGGGTKKAFSAYHSFATAYAAFLRNPQSFECIVDCIRMGGDTDSNAAITGSLLGVLNGPSVFPREFLSTLEQYEHIKARTEEFFNICAQTR
jgi:ADP-ribosylglycohydrolase